MVFKELEIQGFKSFPDKVKITFGEGVTGVVGPNGSGKSNLSDAVRWVLGETSARQLRAAGKMEDVIFGGTRRRGAMGFAQVRLTLDNSAHTLDLDADEAVIGRRYYRSGESEYSINGQVCRLKDVYELLLDTGIGRDGYSVIGQGRIAEIVAAKSTERREIFEEACGIAKYRYRKNEAERRLAAAAENLERLRDILGELEARVGPLEKESARAETFLALSAQRKTLEVTLWTDDVHRAREAVRRQVRDHETAQADYERFDRQVKAAESEAEEIRMQAQQLTIAVERLNGDIRSITEQISGSESRIAVLENDIARNEESAADLRAEIAAAKAEGDSVGGIVECAVLGLPVGLGGPLFDGMEGRISSIVFGIPAVKGIEFGIGFGAARLRGSENNDPFVVENGTVRTTTNHCGGILGGITNGMPLTFRAAFKPTPSIAKEQQSVNLNTLTPEILRVRGRHDPCIVPRAVPCIEAAAAIAVYDALLGQS